MNKNVKRDGLKIATKVLKHLLDVRDNNIKLDPVITSELRFISGNKIDHLSFEDCFNFVFTRIKGFLSSREYRQDSKRIKSVNSLIEKANPIPKKDRLVA